MSAVSAGALSVTGLPRLGQPVTQVSGRGVVVPGDDVDTDRIIPARFMKCVTFDGLGDYVFYDERFDDQGAPKGHPFDAPRNAGASILVAGRNFGCGSSREHAPQALLRWGVRGVLAPSFAEIFFGNCTTLGVVCGRVGEADLARIAVAVEADPGLVLQLDLAGERVVAGELVVPMSLPGSAREALLSGRWDPLQTLREVAPEVRYVAARLAQQYR